MFINFCSTKDSHTEILILIYIIYFILGSIRTLLEDIRCMTLIGLFITFNVNFPWFALPLHQHGKHTDCFKSLLSLEHFTFTKIYGYFSQSNWLLQTLPILVPIYFTTSDLYLRSLCYFTYLHA